MIEINEFPQREMTRNYSLKALNRVKIVTGYKEIIFKNDLSINQMMFPQGNTIAIQIKGLNHSNTITLSTFWSINISFEL